VIQGGKFEKPQLKKAVVQKSKEDAQKGEIDLKEVKKRVNSVSIVGISS
jgi:hypothetical protein